MDGMGMVNPTFSVYIKIPVWVATFLDSDAFLQLNPPLWKCSEVVLIPITPSFINPNQLDLVCN